jgi:hypothetical protein
MVAALKLESSSVQTGEEGARLGKGGGESKTLTVEMA